MGSVNLDNTGSGGAITLSSDGTSLLLGGSAVGGLNLVKENYGGSSTLPNVTGSDAVGIGERSVVAGTSSTAIGNSYAGGTGYNHSVHIGSNSSSYGATGTMAIAGAGQAKATANFSIALSYGAQATATYAFAVGNNALASSTGAVALGASRATGSNSFAAGIGNSASSYGALANGAVALGSQASASAEYSKALGTACQATATGSTAIGEYARASGTSSLVISTDITGDGTLATASQSIAIGANSKSAVIGKIAHSSKRFAANGDAQGGIFVLLADTTDATATVLTTNNSTAAATNQIVAASDTCITFDGTITAMQNGAQAYASWRIEGLLVNDGGTTTLANSATTVIDNQSSWVMALSADNTNNALAITCTGEASHNIRWVANIRTSEVTYA